MNNEWGVTKLEWGVMSDEKKNHTGPKCLTIPLLKKKKKKKEKEKEKSVWLFL